MSGIKLDPKKLLGFKILASGNSEATMRSPKIGVKNCDVVSEDTLIVTKAPIAAKIGFKTV